MLRETRPSSVRYLDRDDALVLTCGGPGGRARSENITLLLDQNGFLVGVDTGEGMGRLVLMMGPHEAVASTRDAQGEVSRDEGDVTEVRIDGAKAKARGDETSPYL